MPLGGPALRLLHLRPIPLLLRDERWGLSLVLFLISIFYFPIIRGTTGGSSGTDGTFSVILCEMARLASIVAVNVAHDVTQRGNARQFILAADSERLVYLQLLKQYAE